MNILTGATLPRVLSPLRQRSYALLWAGQTASVLGDRVYATALPFLVFALGGAAGQLGTAFAFSLVPQVIFLLAGGVLTDRLPRRSVMLACDMARALILMVIAAMLHFGVLRIPHVYAASAAFGFFSAFFHPAATGLLPEVVPSDRLVAANALRSLSIDLAGIFGPILGGVLSAGGIVALALGFDSLTFVVSGLCLLAMGRMRPRQPREGRRRGGYRRDLVEGFRLVAASQWLWVTIALFSLDNVFFAGSLQIALPLLAQQELGGARAFGYVLSSFAAGSLLTALALGQLGTPRRRGVLAYSGVLVSGVTLVLLSRATEVWHASLVAVVLGGSIVAFSLVWESTLQDLIPHEALGRVASIDLLGSISLMPVGLILAGVSVDRFGPGATILIGGFGSIVIGAAGLSLGSIRNLA